MLLYLLPKKSHFDLYSSNDNILNYMGDANTNWFDVKYYNKWSLFEVLHLKKVLLLEGWYAGKSHN